MKDIYEAFLIVFWLSVLFLEKNKKQKNRIEKKHRQIFIKVFTILQFHHTCIELKEGKRTKNICIKVSFSRMEKKNTDNFIPGQKHVRQRT